MIGRMRSFRHVLCGLESCFLPNNDGFAYFLFFAICMRHFTTTTRRTITAPHFISISVKTFVIYWTFS